MSVSSSPLVSVVIPSYNHAAYIGEAIRSVLAQSLRDLELIIIDDGSRDESPARIGRVLSDLGDLRARLVARENRGLCRTLNQGLVEARGRYFAYLGSDDLWEPLKLESQVVGLEREGPGGGAAYSDCYIIDGQGRRLDRYGRQFPYRGGDIYHDLLMARFHPASPTNLFVRRKLIAAGGFNESIPVEDRDAWLRLARHYRIAYIPEPLGSFRVHGANTHKTGVERMLTSNESTLARTLRVDPCSALWRRRLEAINIVGRAAVHYEGLEMKRARLEAFGALRRYPFDRLGWRVVARSMLGGSLVGWLRRTRRGRLSVGGG